MPLGSAYVCVWQLHLTLHCEYVCACVSVCIAPTGDKPWTGTVIGYPLDVVKTRMQMHMHLDSAPETPAMRQTHTQAVTWSSTARGIMREEGALGYRAHPPASRCTCMNLRTPAFNHAPPPVRVCPPPVHSHHDTLPPCQPHYLTQVLSWGHPTTALSFGPKRHRI